MPWSEVVRVARANFTENFVDPDDFDEERAEEYVYEIEITERRYAPGLYLATDWEPHHIWKVFPTRVLSVRDLRNPQLEAS